MFTCDNVHGQSPVVKAYTLSGWLSTLSKTTKLILLDSLLQEVCTSHNLSLENMALFLLD